METEKAELEAQQLKEKFDYDEYMMLKENNQQASIPVSYTHLTYNMEYYNIVDNISNWADYGKYIAHRDMLDKRNMNYEEYGKHHAYDQDVYKRQRQNKGKRLVFREKG